MLPGALATALIRPLATDLAMALATAKVLPLATTTVMATLLVMPPASALAKGLATEVRPLASEVTPLASEVTPLASEVTPLPLVTVKVLLTRQAMLMLLTILKEVLIRQQTMVHLPWSMLWTLQHMKRKLPMKTLQHKRSRRHMDSMLFILSRIHTRNHLPTMIMLPTVFLEVLMRIRQTTIFSVLTFWTHLLMKRRKLMIY